MLRLYNDSLGLESVSLLSYTGFFLSRHVTLGQLILFWVSLAYVNKKANMLKWDGLCSHNGKILFVGELGVGIGEEVVVPGFNSSSAPFL